MSKYFRQRDDSSDDSEGSSCVSGLNPSERATALRPHSNDHDGSSSPERDFNEYLIDRPTLPVHPSLIPAVRFDPHGTPPGELPVAVVQDILQSVPTLDWTDNDHLYAKFRLKRYSCDPIDVWLQAVDPGTGNSLVHAVVLSGRVGALGVCQMPATCGFMAAHLHGMREKYMLLTHPNHEGDTGLHVAARMGSLPMVRGLLRLLLGNSHLVEAPGEFERPKNETGVEMSDLVDEDMILFIEARNNSGRNAIREARHYAREEVAVFLEYVLDQSYLSGCVDRASVRQASRLVVDRRYMFRTSQEEAYG